MDSLKQGFKFLLAWHAYQYRLDKALPWYKLYADDKSQNPLYFVFSDLSTKLKI